MSQILKEVQALVTQQNILISDHGYDELASDNIFVQDVIEGVKSAILVEDYPEYPRDRACWFFNSTENATPFMLFGEFRKANHPRRWL